MKNPTTQPDYTFGKVSLKQTQKKIKSVTANVKAKMAGYTNQSPSDFFAHAAKAAPINGPIIKPSENAIPIRAIPFPLCFIEHTSAIIAILKDTFPLLIPPTNLANTNKNKLLDSAHIT